MGFLKIIKIHIHTPPSTVNTLLYEEILEVYPLRSKYPVSIPLFNTVLEV